MHWGNILTQKKKCILFTTLHELSFSSKLPCSYCTLRLLTQAILSWAQSKFNISVGVRVKGRLQAYIAVRCKVQQWPQLCLTQVHTWLHCILLCCDPSGPFGTSNGEMSDANVPSIYAERGSFSHLWETGLHLAKGNISYLCIFVIYVWLCWEAIIYHRRCSKEPSYHMCLSCPIVQKSHIVTSLLGKGDILGLRSLLFGCSLHPLFCKNAENTKS